MSRPLTRRKCRCCSQMFVPDPRTTDRQHYCFKPGCRQASKAAAQRRWLSKNGNGDYFRGADQVRRVQLWRQRHPGYWKKKTPSSPAAQTLDNQKSNPDQSSCNAPSTPAPALQDDSLAKNPTFVGLISMVMGITLQEDIDATAYQLLLRGRNILGGGLPETIATSIEPGS